METRISNSTDSVGLKAREPHGSKSKKTKKRSFKERSVSSSPSRELIEEPEDGLRAKAKTKSEHSKKKQKKKKRKKEKMSREKERSSSPSKRQPVQLSKHLYGDDSKYSSITGSKIKLKVDKSKSDKEEDQKRRSLLDFLNSSYE